MANIEENEIFVMYELQCKPSICIIVIIWWIYYHLVVVSVLLWILMLFDFKNCASSHRSILEITISSFWTWSYLLCLASSFYQYYQSMYTWLKILPESSSFSDFNFVISLLNFSFSSIISFRCSLILLFLIQLCLFWIQFWTLFSIQL